MNKAIDVLFLTGLFPKEMHEEILQNSKGTVQNAANNLQWELVEGFDKILEKNLSIINSLFVGSYPKNYKKLIIKKSVFFRNQKAKEIKNYDINTNFLNIPLLKNYSKYKSIIKQIDLWIDKKESKSKVLILYAMTGINLKIAKYVKGKDPDIHISLIVPDLPEFMNFNPNILYKVLKKIEIDSMKKNEMYIDSFTLLTEQMNKKLSNTKPYTVMEGIAPSENIPINNHLLSKDSFERTILYTGGLNESYGVINLINSFMKLDNPNYKLILCGSGPEEERIKKFSMIDPRIIFLGQVPRNEVLELQRKSTLLINPRLSDEEYTKYSFPSKMLEYMASKKPVAAYMLDGIPSIYKDYIFELNKSIDLSIQIEKILNKPIAELNFKGEKSFEFVTKNKNNIVQSKKILDLIFNTIAKSG